jgi:hypothetical protein
VLEVNRIHPEGGLELDEITPQGGVDALGTPVFIGDNGVMESVKTE